MATTHPNNQLVKSVQLNKHYSDLLQELVEYSHTNTTTMLKKIIIPYLDSYEQEKRKALNSVIAQFGGED